MAKETLKMSDEVRKLLEKRGIQIDELAIYGIEEYEDHYELQVDGKVKIKKRG